MIEYLKWDIAECYWSVWRLCHGRERLSYVLLGLVPRLLLVATVALVVSVLV